MIWQADRIRRELAEKHPHLASKLVVIRFEVSARMTLAAGTAYPMRSLVKLSLPFFADDGNFEKEFRKTITHEIAHILVPPKREPWQRRVNSHGLEWELMDRSLGGDGKRCHTLKLAEGYSARRDIRVEMPCFKCGKPLPLKPRQAATYRVGITMGSLGPGTGHGFCHRYGCPK